MAVDVGALPIARNTALLSAAHVSAFPCFTLPLRWHPSRFADVIEVECMIGLGQRL
jgi:hypothetical protein